MKKKLLIITLILFAINANIKSQNSFTLPDGFHTYKDDAGNEYRADGDFDGDGINDLAILCAAQDQSNIIVIYLGGKYLVDRSYYWFPSNSELTYIAFENKVLNITQSDCAGKCYTDLKFKYYQNINNMKLIGYDEGNYGSGYSNEGAYRKSINLNTGEYEIAGVKRKVTTDLITLSNVEKYFDYLNSVGSNYIGK